VYHLGTGAKAAVRWCVAQGRREFGQLLARQQRHGGVPQMGLKRNQRSHDGKARGTLKGKGYLVRAADSDHCAVGVDFGYNLLELKALLAGGATYLLKNANWREGK
jgi:hypothetical protein